VCQDNGVANVGLTNTLESLNETGPVVQFFTIGIDPSTLAANNVLTLSINEGGDGGDGWAIDFLTVGVSTQSATIPEPSALIIWSLLIPLLVAASRRSVRSSRYGNRPAVTSPMALATDSLRESRG